VPLTLFVVESVTNAFRHGFNDDKAGSISVNMVSVDGHAELVIDDSGAGYVISGTPPRMGVELMRAFATQLGGTLDVTSSATGTCVKLRYPLAPDG
jgi:two-component sensor histidine kinase